MKKPTGPRYFKGESIYVYFDLFHCVSRIVLLFLLYSKWILTNLVGASMNRSLWLNNLQCWIQSLSKVLSGFTLSMYKSKVSKGFAAFSFENANLLERSALVSLVCSFFWGCNESDKFLENAQLFLPFQFCFRVEKSTSDPLVSLNPD